MFDCSRRTSANARRRSRRRRCKSRPRRARRRRRPDAREREDAHFKSSLNALKCVAFLDKKKSFGRGSEVGRNIQKETYGTIQRAYKECNNNNKRKESTKNYTNGFSRILFAASSMVSRFLHIANLTKSVGLVAAFAGL